MGKVLEKISLGVIYLAAGISLATPLLVDNGYFFPFISSKIFVLRSVIEFMLLAYLLLNVVTNRFRPRLNVTAMLLLLFVGTATISSILGGNFYQSFWGDMERGEGLLLWLHLLMFFLILISVFREKKVWLIFLDISVVIALLLSLFGLGQALKISALLTTSGTRVDSTVGNPAFFAAYLLFHIAFALFLAQKRSETWAKVYYFALSILFAGMILATQTRGAVLGLALGMFLAGILYAWFYRESPVVRKTSLGLVVFVLFFWGFLFAFKNQPFIQGVPQLQRIATISLSERTAQTRLVTWRAALSGWQEKFFLGWGLENFENVFNKYFPPIIYEDEGSQVWFDRAHNVIFDRAVTTGIAGLVLFLAMLLYPALRLLRSDLTDPETKSAAIIFSAIFLAYLVQDLFVFETITVYVILFFTLAFISSQFQPDFKWPKILEKNYLWQAGLIIYLVAIGPMLWTVNLYPAKINRAAAAALQLDSREVDFFVIVDRFKRVIEAPTYGRQEYRLQFIEFVDGQLANLGEVMPEVKPVVVYTDEVAETQLASDPSNAKNYLLIMRHYNYTFAMDPKTKFERLEKALSFYPKLLELSPTRPHIHQEAGYSYTYLYRNFKEQNDQTKADHAFREAEKYFKLAVELNPKVVESYVNLVMLYLNSADDDKVSEIIRQMEERGINFRQRWHLSKMYNLALSANRVRWVGYFSEELTKLNSGDVESWINLAVFYATSGNRAKAIEIAAKIREFGGEYATQADLFIESVNKGEYEKK